MASNDEDNFPSIVPKLLNALMTKAGPSHTVEITEVKEEETSDGTDKILIDRLLSGSLTYNDYTSCMGDDSDEENEIYDIDDDSNTPPSESTIDEVDTPPVSETVNTVKKVRIKRSVLPVPLQGLMGEANLRWARGDSELAEKFCFEIIRQVPTAAEPFQTLAQIYEVDNPEKSQQFALIAAHLSPKDAGPWIRYAAISEEKGDWKQAKICYTKAINASPKSLELHLKRLEIYKATNDSRKMLTAGLRMLGILTAEHSELILTYSQTIAEELFKLGKVQQAKEAMENLFSKCPQMVTQCHVNRMVEVLLGCKNYERVLEVLVEHCDVSIEVEKQIYEGPDQAIEEKLLILNYHLPDDLAVDIHAKFVICLIQMKMFNLLDMIILEVNKFSTEQSGDLMFDIAEAFMLVNLHQHAFTILDALVKTEKFCMAAVWLRHAECLQVCRRFPEAIDSYQRVIDLAPQLAEVRMTLSTLLREQGRLNESIGALQQELTCDLLDPQLLIQRCKLLRQHNQIREYLRDSFLLLSRHCADEKLVNELSLIPDIIVTEDILSNLKSAAEVFKDDVTTTKCDKPNTRDKEKKRTVDLSVEQEWKLFKDIIHISMLIKDYNLMHRIAYSALQSKKFTKDYKRELDFYNVLACIHSGDATNGYNTVRYMIFADIQNVKVWNLFNVLLQRPDDGRHNRFLMRLLTRCNLDISLHTLHANNCLIAGTYKYALSEYSASYRFKENPLLAFLIAVTLFQMSCQKSTAKKHSLVVQGLAFMTQYKRLRGEQAYHEVYYNFGRAFHQLGVLPLAIYYYKKVLHFKSKLLEQKHHNSLDIRQEAAFNLSLCYRKSGAKDLAIMYLNKYITI